MMDGREIRLRRLMGQDRAVVIAFDHGLFDGPIPAMENLPETAKKINPQVDGVLLAPGMVRHCHVVFAGRNRPAAVVRLNWNSVYCFALNYRDAKGVYSYSPEDALREGMDVALVSLTLQTGSEERDAANVELFARLTNQCHRLGIPVIGEYFPIAHLDMSAEELHEHIYRGARIVSELGADLVKTFNTCNFRAVTNTCPVPILGLGAEKLPTQRAALELAASEVANGAGGVVFGRNALQVPVPIAFQAALCEVVRDEAKVDDVIRKYKIED